MFELLFDKLINKVVRNFGLRAKMILLISSSGLNNDLVIPLQKITSFSGKYVLAYIESVLQSKQDLKFDSSFRATCGVIVHPQIRMAGRVPLIEFSAEKNFSLQRKNSIFLTPIEDDNQCLLRSICYGLNHLKYGLKWQKKT